MTTTRICKVLASASKELQENAFLYIFVLVYGRSDTAGETLVDVRFRRQFTQLLNSFRREMRKFTVKFTIKKQS